MSCFFNTWIIIQDVMTFAFDGLISSHTRQILLSCHDELHNKWYYFTTHALNRFRNSKQTQTSMPKLFVHSNYKRVNNDTRGRVGQYWKVYLQNKVNQQNSFSRTRNNSVFLISGDLNSKSITTKVFACWSVVVRPVVAQS